MLSRARRGVCEIVAGAALWRCRCEIVAGAALWRCRCRSRGRRSILRIWVCACVAGVAFGSCLEGQDVVARAAGGVRNRGRRSTLAMPLRNRGRGRRSILCIWVCVCVAGVAFGSCLEGQDVVARAAGGVRNRGRRSTLAMPLRNRGRRSTLAMPLPKSWQAQHSVHLGVCLCGRGCVRQLSRGTGCCRARGGGCAKSWQAQHFGDAVAKSWQAQHFGDAVASGCSVIASIQGAHGACVWTFGKNIACGVIRSFNLMTLTSSFFLSRHALRRRPISRPTWHSATARRLRLHTLGRTCRLAADAAPIYLPRHSQQERVDPQLQLLQSARGIFDQQPRGVQAAHQRLAAGLLSAIQHLRSRGQGQLQKIALGVWC